MYERWQDRSHHHRHQPAIIANNNNCKRHYDIMSYVINAIHMCAVLVLGLWNWWDTGICESQPARHRSRRLFIIIIVISFIHLFFHFTCAPNDNGNRRCAWWVPALLMFRSNFIHFFSLSMHQQQRTNEPIQWTNFPFVRLFGVALCVMANA